MTEPVIEAGAPPPEASVFKYWAFISYSHRDKKWGDWLHHAIETYKVPGHLAGRASGDGKIPARLFPVFRDRDELPTSGDLGSNIDQALRASRCLVVICSPHAAASRWVDQEIRNFKALGREDRILCLVVDGEPNGSDKPGGPPECFPEALRYKAGPDGKLTTERAEPIAADARPGQDGRDNCRLKVLAGILRVGFDELRQRDLERRRRRRAWLAACLAALALALAGTWAWQERSKKLQLRASNEVLRTELAYSLLQRGWQRLAEADPFGAAAFFSESNALKPSRPARLNAQALLYGFPEPLDVEDLSDPIISLAYVPDSGHWLIAHQDSLRFWDIRKRRQVSSLKVEEPGFSPSPDGVRTLLPGSSPAVIDWRKQVSAPFPPRSGGKLLTWDPSGKAFLTITSENGGQSATLRDAATGRALAKPFLLRELPSKKDDVFVEKSYSEAADKLKRETEELLKSARALMPDREFAPPSLSLPEDGDSPNFQLTPGGNSLLTTGGWWGRLQLWSFSSEARETPLPGLLAKAGSVKAALSPDGNTVVTIKRAKELAGWDRRTGAFLGASSLPGRGEVLTLSPDSRLVFAGGEGGGVIRDPRRPEQGGPELRPVPAAGGRVSIEQAVFAPGGGVLATRQADGSWQLWDSASGGPLGAAIPWDGFQSSLARFSPDGRSAATVTNDHEIRTWGLAKARPLYWKRECYNAAAAFDGQGKGVRLWCPGDRLYGLPMLHRHDIGAAPRMKTPEPEDVILEIVPGAKPGIFRRLPPGVSEVLGISQDGRRIVVAHKGGLGLLEAGGNAVWTIDSENYGYQKAILSPGGGGLVMTGGAKVWRFSGPRKMATEQELPGPVHQASWSGDGSFLLLGFDPDRPGGPERSAVLDPASGKLVSEMVEHRGLTAVALSPEAGTFATAGKDRLVRFWDRQGRPLGSPVRTRAAAGAMAFSPDGLTLAVLEADLGVELWDVETREPLAGGIRPPPGLPPAGTGRVEFSADGSGLLAVAGDYSPTVLWLDLGWLREVSEPAELSRRSALVTQRVVTGGRIQLLTSAGWRNLRAEAGPPASPESSPPAASTAGKKSKEALKLYQSGLAHYQNMEIESARKDWTRARALDPSNEDVAEGLERLELLMKGDSDAPAGK